MRKKITIIGAGNVGSMAAQFCMLKDLGDIVLLDINEDIAKGKALDIGHAEALYETHVRVTGTANYADTADSDIIVVTAGIARKPGMSRDDLVRVNFKIVTDVVKASVAVSPNAIFIVVSNPLDIMCMVALKASGLAPQRVIGLSGMLDASRFKYYIAEATGVSPHTVDAVIFGEHGESMVPLISSASIGGVPVKDMLDNASLENIVKKTVSGGATVLGYLGTSAYYAPGAAVAFMVESILTDSNSVVLCSAYLDGEYGAKDIYMCVPVRLNSKGVDSIVNVDLSPEDKAAVAKSVKEISTKLAILSKI